MQPFPKFSQWKQIFKVLTYRERITLLVLFVLAIGALAFLLGSFYLNNTNQAPAFGGTYVEGVVGQPRFINPIYGETNDIDRTLINLVFSGLTRYDKDGKIALDLARSVTISGDGKTYTFTLKDDILWHDRRPLTVDDVIFTIKTIQNSDYKSPLRANWIDVQVQKISDKSLSFTLKQPYNSFLENCTVKIIPEHIWENISPENFALSLYNLQPIGSGPFEFKTLEQTNTGFIKTLQLQSNRKYYNSPSFISQISFVFFEKFDDVIRAAKSQKINGFAESQIGQGWSGKSPFVIHSFSLPRYFAVFLNNEKSSIFSDANIRKALTQLVDKNDLVSKISQDSTTTVAVVDSPILPDFFGYQNPKNVLAFSPKEAETLLDKTGFKKGSDGLRQKVTTKTPSSFKSYLKTGSRGAEVAQLQACLAGLSDTFKNILASETNGTYGKSTETAVNEFQKQYLPELPPTGEIGSGTRAKLNELCAGPSQNSQALSFTLVTINQSQLVQVANLLKDYWAKEGILVNVKAVSITDLKPIIKERSYDALLYGETLGVEPDLYPFWYSTQKQDPGLNLTQYENKDVDNLLKDARQTQDPTKKAQDLEKLQEIIIKDAPALFLYNPDYVYWVWQKVQGVDTQKIVDPSKRFTDVNNWFIKTKRIWK